MRLKIAVSVVRFRPWAPFPPAPEVLFPARTRVQTQLRPPAQNRSENDCGAKTSGEFVVTGCHPSPILEMRKCPFDNVAALESSFVERVQALSRRVLFDHRGGSTTGQKRTEGVAVVGRVAQQRLCRRQRLDQSGRRFDVMAIAAGQFERDDPAVSIDDRMNFRGSSAPAPPDGLLLGPPFPPAAHRCALAVVLSMH